MSYSRSGFLILSRSTKVAHKPLRSLRRWPEGSTVAAGRNLEDRRDRLAAGQYDRRAHGLGAGGAGGLFTAPHEKTYGLKIPGSTSCTRLHRFGLRAADLGLVAHSISEQITTNGH
jgi:hypothetical protein